MSFYYFFGKFLDFWNIHIEFMFFSVYALFIWFFVMLQIKLFRIVKKKKKSMKSNIQSILTLLWIKPSTNLSTSDSLFNWTEFATMQLWHFDSFLFKAGNTILLHSRLTMWHIFLFVWCLKWQSVSTLM